VVWKAFQAKKKNKIKFRGRNEQIKNYLIKKGKPTKEKRRKMEQGRWKIKK